MAAPRSLLALFDRVRASIEPLLEKFNQLRLDEHDVPRPVLNILDPVLGAQELVQLTVTLAASARQRLSAEKLLVRDCIIYGGPRADGSTANTSTVFVGNSQVTLANGAPLVAGGALTLGVVDLAEVYVIGATASDLVRVLYKPV